MCRLVYVYDKNGDAFYHVIGSLRVLEDISGGDGFGIVYKNNGKFEVIKDIGKIKEKQFDNIKTELCIGMTRYATIGKISINNQQPFEIYQGNKLFGWIFHNGSLYPHRYPEKYKKFANNVQSNLFKPWRELEISDTMVMAMHISDLLTNGYTIEDYLINEHPKDQTIMILTVEEKLYLYRGFNPLKYTRNSKFLEITNQWGKPLERGAYVVDKFKIKEVK